MEPPGITWVLNDLYQHGIQDLDFLIHSHVILKKVFLGLPEDIKFEFMCELTGGYAEVFDKGFVDTVAAVEKSWKTILAKSE